MDLQITSETFGTADYRWLGSKSDIDTARPKTFALGDMVEATHYPEGYVKSGLLVAQYTTGGNSGLFGIYTDDATDGRETAIGILLQGPRVRKSADGSLVATVAAGAVLERCFVDLAFVPGHLLLDGTTPNVIDAADLPTHIQARV